MDRLKGEPGSGRREVQQKKACVFNPSNSTTRLIWTALFADGEFRIDGDDPAVVEDETGFGGVQM
jgi:hypothetical protein